MTTKTQTIQSQAELYLMGNYGKRDLALVRGEGIFVWDADGRRYIDCLSGLGVNNLGHCHPRVVEAVKRQVETLIHVSNLYLIEPQVELARLLVEHSPADRVFFCNSGTEAVEAALKCARKYSYCTYGPGRHRILALKNSFHGRTMGALSATGQAKYHEGFQPLIPDVGHVTRGDFAALRDAVDETVCAVILEPVQGEGGVYPCDEAYLRQVRALCDERDIVLIFDEVQCGLGRTGHLFAGDEFGVRPDLICLAKGLAGGVPIGAMLAVERVAATLTAGSHAATFGGNPLSCAAGVAAFSVTVEENLPQRSKALGAKFRAALDALRVQFPCIQEVRGRGLMVGVEMDFPVAEILPSLREAGYLCGQAGPQVLRFLPPLIIEEAVLFEVLGHLEAILAKREN